MILLAGPANPTGFPAWLENFTARWTFPMLVGSVGLGIWMAGPLAPGAILSPYLLALLTLAVSTSLDWTTFRSVRVDARSWARAFLLGHPAFLVGAWLLGLALGLPDAARSGLLLLALAPPANTASMWTSAARGDVAVALSGIALGNVVAPALLALPLALTGASVGAGTGLLLAWRVLFPFVLVPAVAGMVVGGRDPFRASGWQRVFKLLARAAVVSIMLFNAAALWQQSRPPASLLVPLAAGVIVIEGAIYALGALSARSGKIPSGRAKAFAFLQGTRNTALVIALASAALGPEGALPAMVAFIVQEPLAALVAARMARRANPSGHEVGEAGADVPAR